MSNTSHHQPLQHLTTATLRKTKRQPSMPSGLCAAVLVAYSAPEGQCAGSSRVSLTIWFDWALPVYKQSKL